VTFWDIPFWTRVWKGLQRLAGGLLLFGGHKILELAMPFIVGKDPAVEYYAGILLKATFLIVYAVLLSDIVHVIVGWERRRTDPSEVATLRRRIEHLEAYTGSGRPV
jgi:hypothetical protein